MKLQGKQVLVTGGTGFVGSHLVERLLAEGCRVRVLGNYKSLPNIGNLAHLKDEAKSRISIAWGDICDRDSVLQVTEGVSVVFHLAALIGIPYSYVAPASYVATNVGGTLNVLQAARTHGVQRVVHTSTSEIYGSAQYKPMDEKHPLVAQSPYSAAKNGADKLAESFARSFDLPAVIIRPFNIFGPRQSDRAVIPTIIAQRLAGKDPVRIGDPSPRRDFTYVSDAVEGFVRAAVCDEAVGRTINLGSGQSVSIGELANLICELTGGGTYCSDIERTRPAGSEVTELLCDRATAKELLGWSPQVSLTEGLRRTIEFVRENSAVYSPDQYRI